MSKCNGLPGFKLHSYFAHARTAFWYGLQQLPMERGQAILVPDYVCDVLLHPLKELGIRVVFYPVNDAFVPGWEALESLQKKESARALLLVHYFGQPQDLDRARKFCDQQGLWLIEDNAHGHGGTLGGRPLGSFGDLGISSPRKNLLTSSGGMLYLYGQPVEPPSDGMSDFPVSNSKELLCRLLQTFPRMKALVRQALRPEPDFSDPRVFPEIRMEYHRAGPVSTRRINAEDWPAHAELRREAWRAWSHFAIEQGLQPVWQEPHAESCPWAQPVYVPSPNDRLHWLRSGWAKGLEFFPWPTLPESILRSSQTALVRWQRLFCIPLHQTPD